MAEKDYKHQHEGLNDPAAAVGVPNTVSRSLFTRERAFTDVVTESGKPILDSELNLSQQAAWWQNNLLRKWQVPSGWLRGQTHWDGLEDYLLGTLPAGVVPQLPTGGGSVGASVGGSVGSGSNYIAADGTMVNIIALPRIEAIVAGFPVVVEYMYTSTPGFNLVLLDGPTVYDGTAPTVKRTDFLFLEVWKAVVAPSPKASGSVQVASIADLQVGDRIIINGISLTAAGAPGFNLFAIQVGDENATAQNIANALNLATNSFSTMVSAIANNDTVTIKSRVPGAGAAILPPTGNFIQLSVVTAVIGSLAVSGPTLTGGADRPNKPSTQDLLYPHGNVQAGWGAYLFDELVDPPIDLETSQRVQLQYRIRATGAAEGINYKIHPDGFSSPNAGPPPTPMIYAQGPASAPVSNASGRAYPFVRADQTSTWLNSSAPAYGLEDAGLWIAGNGTEQAAMDIGAVDGFVYAIPLCFVHRHNNVSDSLAGFKGFDPLNNANGAPTYEHALYVGPLGTIPADKSDRPDEHFCDVVHDTNVLDLRRHVQFPGVDTASELQYQMQSLLDGNMRTWSVDTSDKQDLGGDSGDVSTQMLVCNEIGRAGPEGAPPISGDTQRGVFVRNFDHVSRRFADQPVVERVVVAFYPGDRPSAIAQGGPAGLGTENAGKYVVKPESGPGVPIDATGWYEGDVLHLDLDALDVTTLGGLFQGTSGDGSSAAGVATPTFSYFAPLGTVITDVLLSMHDDGHTVNPVDQTIRTSLITGLGTQHLAVTLDINRTVVNGGDPANPDYRMAGYTDSFAVDQIDGSPRRIFLEVEITYPIGVGTTDTPDRGVEPDPTVYVGDGKGPGPIIETDTTQRPRDYEGLLEPQFRGGYREIKLEYVANDTSVHAAPMPGTPIGQVNIEQIVSVDQNTLYFPRRVYGTGSGPMSGQTRVTDHTGVPRVVNQGLTEYGSSTRKVIVSDPLAVPQSLCDIQYFAQDPVPNYGVLGGGYQVGVYFRTNSPQTAGVKDGNVLTSGAGTLPTTLNVEPLLMGTDIWTGQTGMGSQDRSYPYGTPLDQIPINDQTQLTREWFFCASTQISIEDFNTTTGLLTLHAFVQADAQNVFSFGGVAAHQSPLVDAEFRALYPFADNSVYRPTLLTQPLTGAVRHKTMVPFLARATETVPGVAGGVLFRKDEVLLVVLSRFAELDDENNVRFTDPPADNRTCAAVYRTRNNLIVANANM